MLLAVRDGDDEPGRRQGDRGAGPAVHPQGPPGRRRRHVRRAGQAAREDGRQDGETGADLFSDLITDKRFLPYLEPPTAAWAHPKLEGTETTTGGGYSARGLTMDVELPADVLPFFKRNRLTVDMNNRGGQGWALKVVDRVTGEDKYTRPRGSGTRSGSTCSSRTNIPYRFVQVKGHVAVVTMHGNHPQTGLPIAKVYAYDLADKKKLWNLDLFGATPNAAVPSRARSTSRWRPTGCG